MKTQKIMQFLFLAVPVLLLLSIFWHVFAPFLSLALLYLMLLVFRSGFVQTLLGKHHEPTVLYQPPQHPGEPQERIAGFGLTPPEYRPAAESEYGQGYQAQPWTPSRGYPEPQPKQEYDQPQIHYPELELPPQ
jgi:hypothetical protein